MRGLVSAADCAYELRIGNLAFEARVTAGRCLTRESTASRPDAVLSMDVTALHALLLDGMDPQAAVRDGLVTGDTEYLDRFTTTFALRPGRPGN